MAYGLQFLLIWLASGISLTLHISGNTIAGILIAGIAGLIDGIFISNYKK